MLRRGFQRKSFPAVSSQDAETLIVQCADLTLLLTPELTVEEIYFAPSHQRDQFDQWIGQRVHSIVANDSRAKISDLVEDNCAVAESEGAWRHLNFDLEPTVGIPLLVKYFAFEDGDRLVQLICARDLSPMLDMQRRLQNELINLEKERATLATPSSSRHRH